MSVTTKPNIAGVLAERSAQCTDKVWRGAYEAFAVARAGNNDFAQNMQIARELVAPVVFTEPADARDFLSDISKIWLHCRAPDTMKLPSIPSQACGEPRELDGRK